MDEGLNVKEKEKEQARSEIEKQKTWRAKPLHPWFKIEFATRGTGSCRGHMIGQCRYEWMLAANRDRVQYKCSCSKKGN